MGVVFSPKAHKSTTFGALARVREKLCLDPAGIAVNSHILVMNISIIFFEDMLLH